MRSEKTVDLMILGAGASGMMAAVQAARAGACVFGADGNEKAGKKLYATGNGRCNLTNLLCTPAAYNGLEDGFTEGILKQFSVEDTIDFFGELGMLIREEQEGRCYPYSGQASSVVHFLEQEMHRLGVRFLPGDRAVASERRQENGIFITELESGRTVRSRTLLIACGGKAGPAFGSTGDGYGLARSFGHTLQPPRPALVGCLSPNPVVKALRGRARAAVVLYENGLEIAREQGEVQFTGMGLSGICVMDLTRFMDAPRPVRRKNRKEQAEADKQYEIGIDFAPEMTAQDCREFLQKAMDRGKSRGEILSGILNSHTAEVFSEIWETTDDAVRLVKDFRVPVEATLGWKDAQVSRGGVRREELEPGSMESRLVPGLYFCGEVVDVDGRCGGYNLQWAWSSGTVCGRNAAARAAGQE